MSLIKNNFSSKILSSCVADKVSELIRRKTIGEMLKNLKDEDQHIVLMMKIQN